MISNAPIQTAQLDAGGLPTLSWTGWYTQVAGALAAFDQNGAVRNNTYINFLAAGNGWKSSRMYQDTTGAWNLDVNTRSTQSGADSWINGLKVLTSGTIQSYNGVDLNSPATLQNNTYFYFNSPGNKTLAARMYSDSNSNLVFDHQQGPTWTNSLTISTTGAVTFSHPESIVFGANWQNWTPSVTGSGSMTVSGVTINMAQFLRIGPICFFEASITLTTGGSPANAVLFSPPLPLAGPGGGILFANIQGSAGSAAFSTISSLYVNLSGGANFVLGVQTMYVSGFYRCT